MLTGGGLGAAIAEAIGAVRGVAGRIAIGGAGYKWRWWGKALFGIGRIDPFISCWQSLPAPRTIGGSFVKGDMDRWLVGMRSLAIGLVPVPTGLVNPASLIDHTAALFGCCDGASRRNKGTKRTDRYLSWVKLDRRNRRCQWQNQGQKRWIFALSSSSYGPF